MHQLKISKRPHLQPDQATLTKLCKAKVDNHPYNRNKDADIRQPLRPATHKNHMPSLSK